MDALTSQIRSRLEPMPDLVVAVLFGSRATGRARPDSDVDVAFLASGDAKHAWDLRMKISTDLADLAPSGRVDVVDLDRAPSLVRHRIIRDGVVLFCRDDVRWHRCKVDTLREHGDREWARQVMGDGIRRWFLERGARV